ncbi:MAG: YdcH family protein [Thermoanaerobaculia bacterium]|nr:YdcH family protein [Thermoanaerobaculia bacterium]
MASQDALQQELLQSDPEYRELFEKHQDLKQELQAIYQKPLLTDQDELEVKRIKHNKLFLKDQMSALARAQQPRSATA